MTQEVFLCFECGQRNRVSAGKDRRSAKCGQCGAALFPGQETKSRNSKSSATRSSPKRSNTTRNQTSQASKNDGRRTDLSSVLRILFFLGGAAALVWVWAKPDASQSTRSNTPQRSASTTESDYQPQSTLPPVVARPSSGVLSNWTGRAPQAPLEIITSPGSDYYVKLVEIETGYDAVAIYVHGGRRVQVDVPLGNYKIKYASGEVWRGFGHLFGPDGMTSYSEAQSTFKFETSGGYVNGYTVELIRRSGGNLRTRSIDRSKF